MHKIIIQMNFCSCEQCDGILSGLGNVHNKQLNKKIEHYDEFLLNKWYPSSLIHQPKKFWVEQIELFVFVWIALYRAEWYVGTTL